MTTYGSARVVELKEGNTSCPYCSGSKVGADNNLEHRYPEKVKEWYPSKNGTIKPTDILPGSNRKVWWQCRVAEKHVWKAGPNSRTEGVMGLLSAASLESKSPAPIT